MQLILELYCSRWTYL